MQPGGYVHRPGIESQHPGPPVLATRSLFRPSVLLGCAPVGTGVHLTHFESSSPSCSIHYDTSATDALVGS
ncbi:hypothetical protein KQX54_006783 [Cotesia glomerata]|uniref:Uncharacterized protein n=1 Tax=Cotesia glomerata TaxID=32391 RepID=A0AAV7I9Y3_COTGL|nr:hypothetical protein KQX54_006783 [Cotesia glomerata]